MKILIVLCTLCFSLLALGQDSPMNAAPGQPPPPEGWTQEPPPNGGIHMPSKKRKYRTRMNLGATPTATPGNKVP
jgi:hypothetical protein